MPRTGTHRPFGLTSACKDALGITPAQLRVVVALMAAERVGSDGATISELASIGVVPVVGTKISDLERARWVECVGYGGENKQVKLWRAHARAWRELGFERSRERGAA